MSSMRNAINRRVHRERAQPPERRHLGLLEKHKDYSKRAKDYNKKKAQLRALRNKASDRNEDEFYHAMLSRQGPGSRLRDGTRWRGTVAGDRGNRALDVDAVRLLKTQDVGYVRTMGQVVARGAARLEQQLVLTRGLDRLDDADDDDDGGGGDGQGDNTDSDEDGGRTGRKPGGAKTPRKILFFDDEGTQRDALDRAHRRPEGTQVAGNDDDDDVQQGRKGDGEADKEEADEDRSTSVRRLRRQLDLARRKRKALADAEAALGVQRAKMAKTATSGGVTRRGREKIVVRTRKR